MKKIVAGNMLTLEKTCINKILKQLILSDGMKIENPYLIQQKIYYVDNTGLIEKIEKEYMEQNYQYLYEEKGNVNLTELLDMYTPEFINYDKFYNELEKKYNKRIINEPEPTHEERDMTLNKYF